MNKITENRLRDNPLPEHMRAYPRLLHFSYGTVRRKFGGGRISSTARTDAPNDAKWLHIATDDLVSLPNRKRITIRWRGRAYRVRVIDIWRAGRPVRGAWSFPIRILTPVATWSDAR